MQDGVIKYQNIHKIQAQVYDPDLLEKLEELNQARTKLFDLGYIGVNQAVSYGNLSLSYASQIYITSSDSSKDRLIKLDKYTELQKVEFSQNTLYSQGLYAPSSEAMTHAAIYASQTKVSSVIHIHSDTLFNQLKAKKFAYTAKDIAYGTVEMAFATQKLVQSLGSEGVFYMAGHEAGIIAYATNISRAYDLIVNL